MATAVFFHAHPDDEAIATAGTMVMARADGHRVVLVTATDGALGEFEAHHVPADSHLGAVREQELRDAAEVLGVDRLELLGYRDSGMEGEYTNDDPECFWQADVDEAARRLAAILVDEAADVLTVYDGNGGYGHPDHIQVHRVGIRAAELAGVATVYETTINRDQMRALAELAVEGEEVTDEILAEREEMRTTEMGTPADEITHAIDVTDVIDRKRRAMAAHRSQITEDSFFLRMPEEAFRAAFGTEWFILRGARRAGEPYESDLFATSGPVSSTDGENGAS